MFINEFFSTNSAEGYSSENDDQSVKKMTDSRKSRLTLLQIKRLRVMNDLRTFERQQEVEDVAKQYKPPAAAGVPGL
jgi:hypothetical protein